MILKKGLNFPSSIVLIHQSWLFMIKSLCWSISESKVKALPINDTSGPRSCQDKWLSKEKVCDYSIFPFFNMVLFHQHWLSWIKTFPKVLFCSISSHCFSSKQRIIVGFEHVTYPKMYFLKYSNCIKLTFQNRWFLSSFISDIKPDDIEIEEGIPFAFNIV